MLSLATLCYATAAEALVTAPSAEYATALPQTTFDAAPAAIADDRIDARAGLMLDRGTARPADPALAAEDGLHADTEATGATSDEAAIADIGAVAVVATTALLAAMIGDAVLRRRRHGPARATIAVDLAAHGFIPAPRPAEGVTFDRSPRLDPLRHFQPDAPPVAASPVEHSRPDYIRIDDALEVWTPSRVDAIRDPSSSTPRRRNDAAGTDYRIHRIDREGLIRVAERRVFATDADAYRFAEASEGDETIEIWLGNRCVATVPPVFLR